MSYAKTVTLDIGYDEAVPKVNRPSKPEGSAP